MKERYSILSDDEPTDEQLADLMHEVSESVRERADVADKKFREEIRRRTREAIAKWEPTIQ